jgi:hypothetical protein
MGYGLDAFTLNTVQRLAIMKTVLTLSFPSKDEILPDELSNCQCITMAVLRRIKLFIYDMV